MLFHWYIIHVGLRWCSSPRSSESISYTLFIPGCGTRFAPFINQDMLDLIFRSVHHTNRFVRESGYQTCATLIEAAADDVYGKFGVDFASHLAEGLADNWSQVRLAAIVATRFKR